VKGTRYFECEENYGSFVRGKNMKVGDYPVRDLLDSDDDDDEVEQGEGEQREEEGGMGMKQEKEDEEDEI
jgi:dynactin complex subunit